MSVTHYAINYPAPMWTVYTQDAWAGNVDTEIHVVMPEGTATTGRILSAEVAPDGLAVTLVIEVDEP
jgi:hypothetical protein